MKKYYRLFNKIGEKFAYIVDLNMSDEDRHKLSNGQKLEKTSFRANVKRESGPFPDLMGISIVQPLVSDKLKEVLLLIVPEEQIQFIPVEVSNKMYWLINVLNNIDCFDREKSEYTTYTSGALRKITKGVLRSELLEGIDLFRVAGRYVDIFISEKLKNSLEESNITGIEIIENDNWEKDWDEEE